MSQEENKQKRELTPSTVEDQKTVDEHHDDKKHDDGVEKGDEEKKSGTDGAVDNDDSNQEMTKAEKKKLAKLEKKKLMKEREKLRKKEKKQQQKKGMSSSDGQAKKKKKKSTTDGITVTKEEDFGEWYLQTITKSEMLEYYDVSGCYILRPNSYQVWEMIQDFINAEIKKLGVRNCYFPMFVTKSALETEKDHIEGFAPEVAWVTKSGNSDLSDHLAIRPTSETIMYPAFAKWIRSHRDLPLQINQWCNVVRWEFKNPVPFLRSREFLWQEGHSAFETLKEAEVEVMQILDIYRRVYEELLAVPVVPGRKTETEKFAGGYYTTTVEGYIPTNGRAIQGATSHCLGQNFSKMFNVQYLDENKKKQYVWQNSWGLTTRTIGVMIMVHSDNNGIVFPPRVAPVQVAIIPLFYKEIEPEELKKKAHELLKTLSDAGIRAIVDDNESKNPGWKYNEYELKGVPLRVELGPRDLKNNQVMSVRRDNSEKKAIPLESISESIKTILEDMQKSLFENAKKQRDENIVQLEKWEDFVPNLELKRMCLVPFCGEEDCEEQIKQESAEESKKLQETLTKEEIKEDKLSGLTGAAKSLCIPLEQPELKPDQKCFHCGKNAKFHTLFGRSY